MCIEQVRNVISIPVPRILAWDGGSSNSAESEYILMEEAKGTQLEELWTDMDLGDKFKVVDDVITIQKKLQSVTFSRFGCPDSVSEYLADIENQIRQPLFQIGCIRRLLQGRSVWQLTTFGQDICRRSVCNRTCC